MMDNVLVSPPRNMTVRKRLEQAVSLQQMTLATVAADNLPVDLICKRQVHGKGPKYFQFELTGV